MLTVNIYNCSGEKSSSSFFFCSLSLSECSTPHIRCLCQVWYMEKLTSRVCQSGKRLAPASGLSINSGACESQENPAEMKLWQLSLISWELVILSLLTCKGLKGSRSMAFIMHMALSVFFFFNKILAFSL